MMNVADVERLLNGPPIFKNKELKDAKYRNVKVITRCPSLQTQIEVQVLNIKLLKDILHTKIIDEKGKNYLIIY
jgi:hypothetical protein